MNVAMRQDLPSRGLVESPSTAHTIGAMDLGGASTQIAYLPTGGWGNDGKGEKKEREFCLSVTLFVKPERRTEFLQVIRANQKGTLSTEPLAKVYEWGESTTEANTFHFHEVYVNRQGFEAHQQTPHFAAWERFASTQPFSKDPEIAFFEKFSESEFSSSDDDSAVRDADRGQDVASRWPRSAEKLVAASHLHFGALEAFDDMLEATAASSSDTTGTIPCPCLNPGQTRTMKAPSVDGDGVAPMQFHGTGSFQECRQLVARSLVAQVADSEVASESWKASPPPPDTIFMGLDCFASVVEMLNVTMGFATGEGVTTRKMPHLDSVFLSPSREELATGGKFLCWSPWESYLAMQSSQNKKKIERSCFIAA